MVLLVARALEIFMFGTKLFKSPSDVTACCCRIAALIAVTATGTSWRFSVRRRAVTTISAKPSEPAAARGGGGGEACARATGNGSDTAMNTAAAVTLAKTFVIALVMIAPRKLGGPRWAPPLYLLR